MNQNGYQFPVQFPVARTIHCFHGLSLNELVFDPTNVKTYGLTYIAFFRIQTKEKMYLLAPLQHENFYVDLRIHIEMNRLKIIATWMPLIPQLKTYVILM